MADITYIPIRQLYPHPDNPRKELGDLSELAASIKENGVYQNLTVIPGHYLNSREYIAKCVDEGGDAAAAAAPTSFLRCMDPAAKRTHPATSAKLLTLNATNAAKLAMTTAMRSSCAERSMANDRPCKV